ncbi:MAG: hypothetical protein Q8O67_33205 [Deltaproteobacteria bacterium]|nr:hypothetical protein [Deltaproteobacteria bacterium]
MNLSRLADYLDSDVFVFSLTSQRGLWATRCRTVRDQRAGNGIRMRAAMCNRSNGLSATAQRRTPHWATSVSHSTETAGGGTRHIGDGTEMLNKDTVALSQDDEPVEIRGLPR